MLLFTRNAALHFHALRDQQLLDNNMKLLLNMGIKSNYSKSSQGSFASSDSMAAETCTDIVLDNSSSIGQKLQQHAVGAVPALSSLVKRSCLIVAMDANNSKELSVSGLVYALQHVVMKCDVLKLGITTYIRHPLGYKCQVEENNHAWLGANPRHLEGELAFRKQMLLDIPHFDALCAQASVVQIDVEVLPGSRPEVLMVKEAQELEAHHVVLDHKSSKNRSMRKYYVDNPSCCVTRIRSRASSGVDVARSIRSLTTVLPAGFSLVSPKSPRRPETDPESLALVSSRTPFLAENSYKSSMFSSSASVASSQGSEAKKGLYAAQDISSFVRLPSLTTLTTKSSPMRKYHQKQSLGTTAMTSSASSCTILNSEFCTYQFDAVGSRILRRFNLSKTM